MKTMINYYIVYRLVEDDGSFTIGNTDFESETELDTIKKIENAAEQMSKDKHDGKDLIITNIIKVRE